MRKIKWILFPLVVSFVLLSCKESINFNGPDLERPYTVGFVNLKQTVLNSSVPANPAKDSVGVNWDGIQSSTDITVNYQVVDSVYKIISTGLYTDDTNELVKIDAITGNTVPLKRVFEYSVVKTTAPSTQYALTDCVIAANTSQGYIKVVNSITGTSNLLVCLVLKSSSNDAVIKSDRNILLLTLNKP
ncbi:MAG: hypothetical protein EHM93_04910 [Bacteroidales bacterium]|nr:MAG: hypothetical protein EHM93_04910 [Bacteroidales bacterium]